MYRVICRERRPRRSGVLILRCFYIRGTSRATFPTGEIPDIHINFIVIIFLRLLYI